MTQMHPGKSKTFPSHPHSSQFFQNTPAPGSSDASQTDSITAALAAAAGGGVAGAAIGKIMAGRVGATIGAVVGSVAGVAMSQEGKDLAHSADKMKDKIQESFSGSARKPIEFEPSGKAIEGDAEPSQIQGDRVIHMTTEAPFVTDRPRQRIVLPAEMHYQLGVSLARQGQLDAAVDEFQAALKLAPESAETHYNLGIALIKQGNVPQGLEALRQSKDLCSQQGKLHGTKVVDRTIKTLQATK